MTPTEQTPDESARDLANRFWERILEEEPLIGTSVGDERYDDRLPDPSEEGLAARADWYRATLVELRALDRDPLSQIDRTTLDVLETIASREVAGIEARVDRLQAASHLWGPGQLLGEIASMQQANTPERQERYLARLAAIPAYLAAIEPILRGAAEAGQTSPGVVVDRAIGQVERLLDTPLEESPALAPVGADVAAAAKVRDVVEREVVPAYRRYLEALEEHRPSATETIGLFALPDGERMYAAQILAWTTLPLSAKEVHELGHAELVKLQEERAAVAARLGFEDPASAIAANEADNHASSRDELVQIARDQVERSWEAAPAMFGHVPTANCEVRPVEEFREADMPFAFYNPPTADGSRAGVYYINTYEPEHRPLHQLASTTHHEANPGHHFQIALEREQADRPPLKRFGGILAGSSFVEGWGLYSERLADEMGLYRNDYELLGMLDSQAFRACRLIVDSGIHAFDWDRQRSVEQMMQSGIPELDAMIEVDRYIALPGQALSYMVGQLEIRACRERAAEAANSGFDLRDFHDRLLSLGSVPLPTLRREMGPAT
jgi:uncharacterized protein (DUF885 family)